MIILVKHLPLSLHQDNQDFNNAESRDTDNRGVSTYYSIQTLVKILGNFVLLVCEHV